jgi:hypothetical protein
MTTTFAPGSTKAKLLARLERSRDDPVYFNEKVLCRAPYWQAQREWAEAVIQYRTVAIETGNMLGKGYLIGGLVPWFIWTRKNSLAYVVGAGQTQIGAVLWKEIRRAVEGCPFWKAGLLPMVVSPGIKSSPATAMVKPGWGAIGLSTSTIERASGHHAANLLVIVDEASGVEDSAWQAIDGLGFSRMLVCGNPLRADGRYAELCDQGDNDLIKGRGRSVSCRHFNVPSTASPHAHLDRSPWGMADRTWLEAMAYEHGEHSPWYRAHVLAIRPKLSHEALIPAEWLNLCLAEESKAAAMKARVDGKAGKRRLGCDVGEGVGKARSVIIVRDDAGILEISANQFSGPNQTAQEVCRLAQKWSVYPDSISFDGSGNTGRDLEKALARSYPNLQPYYGAKSGGKYATNLRTACAMALARRLNPDPTRKGAVFTPFHIPESEHVRPMFRELEELRYRLAGEKTELEAKEDLVLRLGRSPDYGDCLAMTWREEALMGI